MKKRIKRKKRPECAWLSSWKPETMEYKDTHKRRSKKCHSQRHKHRPNPQDASTRSHLIEDIGKTAKNPYVMNGKLHKGEKQDKKIRFNHTDWASGDLRSAGWTEVYFRPHDEADKRRNHLAEK